MQDCVVGVCQGEDWKSKEEPRQLEPKGTPVTGLPFEEPWSFLERPSADWIRDTHTVEGYLPSWPS